MLGAPSCRTASPTHPLIPGSHPGPPLVLTWWSSRPCPVSLPRAYPLSLADSTQSTVPSCGTGRWGHSTLLSCQQTPLVPATVDSGVDVVLMTQLMVTYCWMSLMRASTTEKNSCTCAKSAWRMHVCDGSSWAAWKWSMLIAGLRVSITSPLLPLLTTQSISVYPETHWPHRPDPAVSCTSQWPARLTISGTHGCGCSCACSCGCSRCDQKCAGPPPIHLPLCPNSASTGPPATYWWPFHGTPRPYLSGNWGSV